MCCLSTDSTGKVTWVSVTGRPPLLRTWQNSKLEWKMGKEIKYHPVITKSLNTYEGTTPAVPYQPNWNQHKITTCSPLHYQPKPTPQHFPSLSMDGLLGSEFALVLRDSLNSKPRRHVLPSPSPAPSQEELLSPPKKPRTSELALPCDMKLEPRLHLSAIPTSPTSPLPTPGPTTPVLSSAGARLASDVGSSPVSQSQSPPSVLPVHGSGIGKPRHRSEVSCGVRRQIFSALAEAAPLEFLATVSATQDVVRGVELAGKMPPMSPVNSEGGGEVVRRRKGGKKGVSGRTFGCKLCPSTFSQQFNLNKHVRAVHERRRPFECETCHARFQQKSHRTMHHLAVHEKLRQFGCDHCSASFSWRGVLKKHRKSIHGMDDWGLICLCCLNEDAFGWYFLSCT